MRKEIKIGGLGGQGVILSGLVLGKAASIYDDKFATMTQSFGPEARGSACSAQLIIGDTQILFPYVKKPEILVVMSQDAYNKFIPELSPDGILITEEDLV
ncbi:MAG: 2-oxoacid:acceptor oxidoreductase family protein, partial [Bacteroidia bacterium]|nr:2-oxoacid:acceptor oxidoreductase family protein [Bacteroidia bacterium]